MNSGSSHMEPGTIHIIHCPFSNWELRVLRIVYVYADIKRYEKGPAGIIGNREKTEVTKTGKGKLQDFCKVAVESSP